MSKLNLGEVICVRDDIKLGCLETSVNLNSHLRGVNNGHNITLKGDKSLFLTGLALPSAHNPFRAF